MLDFEFEIEFNEARFRLTPDTADDEVACFRQGKHSEGFEFSHASIMYNALKIDAVKKLVQVGIRDVCQDEIDLINNEA